MAITGISGGVPLMDFSSIGQLPQVYQQAQQQANRERTLAELGQGGGPIDYASAARKVMATDPELGLSLARLGETQAQHAQAKSDSDRSYGLQVRSHDLAERQAQDKPQYMKDDSGNIIEILPYGKGSRVITPAGAPGASSEAPVPPGVNGAEFRKKLASEQAEIWAKRPQAESSVADAHANLDRLKAEAEAIKKNPALWRITGATGMLPSMPGGGAADLEAKLDTLKSQTGFSVLQNMRDASKTGGALGAISDKENIMLQNNLAALSQKQSPEQFAKSLDQVINYVDGAKQRIKAGYDRTYSQFKPPQPAQAKDGGSKESAAAKEAFKANPQAVIAQAKDAIKRGANPAAVAAELGINPAVLGQ